MALNVTCCHGHHFIMSDIYEGWPEKAPYCPVCFVEWAERNNIEPSVWMLQEAKKVIAETERLNAWSVEHKKREQIISKHREKHQHLDSKYCPDCGEEIGREYKYNFTLSGSASSGAYTCTS